MGVGFEPARVTCRTSQVLLAGASGAFSWSTPIFAPPTDLLLSEIIGV